MATSSHQQALYEEIAVIGTGAYGTVYKGFELKSSRIVAMKRIRIQITNEGLPISTVREIAYLRQLEKFDHENVVKLLDVINGPRLASEQSVIIIFEYIDYDLNTYLKSHTSSSVGLGQARIADLMHQLLVGVDFLHSNRIVHRDLKPQNLLITKEGRLKIADFGLARIYSLAKVLTSVVVTLWYRSPEVLLHSAYTSSVDIWSCGCIFAELYMRRPLFIGQSDIDQLYKIFEIMGVPENEIKWPKDAVIPHRSFVNSSKLTAKPQIGLNTVLAMMDPDALNLVNRLLDFDFNARITAHEALNHPYFQQKSLDLAASAAQPPSLAQLPDITNLFQQNNHHHAPNILKRKRINNPNNSTISQVNK